MIHFKVEENYEQLSAIKIMSLIVNNFFNHLANFNKINELGEGN